MLGTNCGAVALIVVCLLGVNIIHAPLLLYVRTLWQDVRMKMNWTSTQDLTKTESLTWTRKFDDVMRTCLRAIEYLC